MIGKIGLGLAAIGRPQYINIRQENPEPFDYEQFRRQGMDVLNAAYQNGVRYFDTAPGYGMAESLLLEWMREIDDHTLEVATKWGYTYTANYDPTSSIHEVKEHSLIKLNEQWSVSKAFLSHLVLYQIHSATLQSGVLENEAVLSRLAALKHEFGFKIGMSTSGVRQVEVIKKALDIHVNGTQLFDAFQVTFNILDQSLSSIQKVLEKGQKWMIAKEVLANGRLFPNSNYPKYQKLYLILQELANYYNVGVDAIALRFCLQTIPFYKILSGAAQVPHILQNLKALDFEMEPSHLNQLQRFKINPEEYWTERKQLNWN